jgi:pyrroline-5-carboxylate reductase
MTLPDDPGRGERGAASAPLSEAIAARGIVLLGCGRMGSALLAGWLARGLPPASVTVLEPAPSEKVAALEGEGLRLNVDPPRAPAVVVLAVKPQSMDEALGRVAGLASPDTLFLSIAAGTTLARLEAALGQGTPIVRAMPNTPAAIGRGISALVGNRAATEADLGTAEALLSAVGATVRLDDEGRMDAVTAVSGSGPAYVFLMIEAMAAAGEAEGLAPDLALALARATVSGAAALAETTGEDPAKLRRDVTSPGGTTAAALEVLADPERGLPPLMRAAVGAAAARGRALGAGATGGGSARATRGEEPPSRS